MDFFKRINRFFNREREVIQNPLAPEPTEVPQADPQQEQREALRSAIHTLILEQVREHCEKGKGRLSIHFPKMAEIDSSAAENIMSRDLEISAEMDIETLHGWVQEKKENPNESPKIPH
ncbi:hypothetical protein V6N11_014318 [Hibiscus sabdariffa]